MAPSHSPQREHTCSDHRSPLSRTWGAQPQQGDRQELNQKLLKKRTRRLIEVTFGPAGHVFEIHDAHQRSSCFGGRVVLCGDAVSV
jgi:2-polyprenyl-6-methoxyphenol hydroxylase-like FAD-dependent oxidoreductase